MAKEAPRVVKRAGKRVFVERYRAGQPTLHDDHASFRMGRGAGVSQRLGERPAMDQNRRP